MWNGTFYSYCIQSIVRNPENTKMDEEAIPIQCLQIIGFSRPAARPKRTLNLMRRYCGPTLNGSGTSCPLTSFLPWVVACRLFNDMANADLPTESTRHWRWRPPPPSATFDLSKIHGFACLFGESDSVLSESWRRIRQSAKRNGTRSQGAGYVPCTCSHSQLRLVVCYTGCNQDQFHDVSEEPYTSGTIC
jgi:hypothetical protein